MIVVDDDGTVVIPKALVEFVAHEGAEHELYESWVFTEVERASSCRAFIRRTTRPKRAMRRGTNRANRR